MSETKRHPKHDEIVALLRQGKNNREICRALHCDKVVVALIRKSLGIAPYSPQTTKAQKLAAHSTKPDDGGHIFWTGRTSSTGVALIRQNGISEPARHEAFRQRTGREPVGGVRPECGQKDCIAGRHLADDIERIRVRGQMRVLKGLPAVPWNECPQGHAWGIHGRFEVSLKPYCSACNNERRTRNAERWDVG